MRAAILAGVIVALAAAPRPVAAQAAAAAADPYDPANTGWDGLSSFIGVAEGLGFSTDVVAALEWGDLDREDLLVILYPLSHLAPDRLSAFVAAGGHVLIADDFGEAGDALAGLSLVRSEARTPAAKRFHDGRVYAPIAEVIAKHPATVGVDQVVTNHPAILTGVEGAEPIVAFAAGEALVAAGQRGTGRFVVVSDSSIFINRMLQFPGNLQLAAGVLRWLSRQGAVTRVVIVRGDVPMYGEPRAFIDDGGTGELGRTVSELNRWLENGNSWTLTAPAARVAGVLMVLVAAALALVLLPLRRRDQHDGSWLRVLRPARPDHLVTAIAAYDQGHGNFLVPATVLRDVIARGLAETLASPEPFYELPREQLLAAVERRCGRDAATALAAIYAPLRALPSRVQAAAPWNSAVLSAREFDSLYRQAQTLCHSLGQELP